MNRRPNTRRNSSPGDRDGVALVPLDPVLSESIAHWFDDPDTRRYLGGRAWLQRIPELIRDAPGAEFRGRQVRARHAWVACSDGVPVALADVEPYSDGTAGLALVVDPAQRGRGGARQVVAALAMAGELAGTHTLIGAVESGNGPARAGFARAGFAIADAPDEEGMLRMRKRIGGAAAA